MHKHSCAGCALYYAVDELFGSDCQLLSDANLKCQKCSKYSIHLNGYVLFFEWAFSQEAEMCLAAGTVSAGQFPYFLSVLIAASTNSRRAESHLLPTRDKYLTQHYIKRAELSL